MHTVNSFAYSRVQQHGVRMVPDSPYDDLSVGEFGDDIETGNNRSGIGMKTTETVNALYFSWQGQRIELQLLLELVNEVNLPFETLELPTAEAEGKKRDEADEDEGGGDPGLFSWFVDSDLGLFCVEASKRASQRSQPWTEAGSQEHISHAWALRHNSLSFDHHVRHQHAYSSYISLYIPGSAAAADDKEALSTLMRRCIIQPDQSTKTRRSRSS